MISHFRKFKNTTIDLNEYRDKSIKKNQFVRNNFSTGE